VKACVAFKADLLRYMRGGAEFPQTTFPKGTVIMREGDSGNSAYRAADYSTAAKRYAAAAVVNPDDPAAFYGLGMALSKLGRDDEARVAYAHSRELSRGEVSQDSLPHEVRYRRTTHP